MYRQKQHPFNRGYPGNKSDHVAPMKVLTDAKNDEGTNNGASSCYVG
jgi:hypothetical protein